MVPSFEPFGLRYLIKRYFGYNHPGVEVEVTYSNVRIIKEVIVSIGFPENRKSKWEPIFEESFFVDYSINGNKFEGDPIKIVDIIENYLNVRSSSKR